MNSTLPTSTELSNVRTPPLRPAPTSPALALNWSAADPENRIGLFRAGRYTSPNRWLALAIAAPITALVFAGFLYGLTGQTWLRPLVSAFVRPGNIYTTLPASLLFVWALCLLALKQRKLRFQERALTLAAMPQDPEFVLHEASAKAVLERLHLLVDHPRHFVLLNRMDRALSNLRNIGGLSDVSTILRDQAENDENQVASSYTWLSGLVWAIPVLGFIGTVQGLSAAIGTFTQTLAAQADLPSIKANLQGVTGGLATAFETTLVALIMALIIQLLLTALHARETEFLDECSDYCHQHVISKLRLIDRPGLVMAPAPAPASASAPVTPASGPAPAVPPPGTTPHL